MSVYEVFECLFLQERHVACQDHKQGDAIVELCACGQHRVGGSSLLRLRHKFSQVADLCLDSLLDLSSLMTYHDVDLARVERLRRAADVSNQRSAAKLVQYFRSLRFHARAESGSENEYVERLRHLTRLRARLFLHRLCGHGTRTDLLPAGPHYVGQQRGIVSHFFA